MRERDKSKTPLARVMDHKTALEAGELSQVQARVTELCEHTRRDLLAILAVVPNALALLATVPTVLEEATARAMLVTPTPEWLSAKQLADYWQLVSDEGELITAGILKWANRADGDFPLPHARLGDLFRFRREEADAWARAEAERRKVAKNRQALKKRKEPSCIARK